MKPNQNNPNPKNKHTVGYNHSISFSSFQELEEEEIAYSASLSPEQRFEYLYQLRKATHNLALSKEEKKAMLNTITINPPDEY